MLKIKSPSLKLDKARNESTNKFYAYKEAISGSSDSKKASTVCKKKSNSHEVAALGSF